MLNSGEMEECDAFGETRFLSRFQAINSKITHKVSNVFIMIEFLRLNLC